LWIEKTIEIFSSEYNREVIERERDRMSSLEALQHRLERFREAGRNLQLDPLVTRKELARLGVEYQIELVDELEQAIEDCASQDNKLVFTGHRGCGKSTLLAELEFRLTETERYFVVRFSISDTIERSAVDHVNILFSMALQLLEVAEQRSINLKPGIKKEFYRWLGKHTQTESKAVEAEIEASTETTIKGGIPLILEFLAKVRSKLKINSVIRQEISTEFARRTSDLVAQINQLQAYIENATGQQVLVIIDDLDKLDLSVTETIFSKNIQSLLEPNCRILYTVPIATLREVSIKANITTYVKKIHTMRVAKFFKKEIVRNPDRTPDQSCVQVFAKILDRRLPQDLIEPDVKQQMILLSGGVLRELIRIGDRCCDKAMQELRGQIRRQRWDQPEVIVNQPILDQVVTELQIEYAEVLGQVDFEMLKSIYQQFKPQDTENQRFLDLFHGLYVLEYRNASLWYDLNPIVHDLLVQEGGLDGATS
jgi:nucleoside-triphosphatase THEP1